MISCQRRWVALAAITCLVMLALVAAECIARTVTEGRFHDEVARMLREHGCRDEGVRASVSAPALWQVSRGRFERVDLTIDDLALRGLTPDVRVVLGDVDVASKEAGSVAVTGLVGWTDLTRQIRTTNPTAAAYHARFVGAKDGRAALEAEVPTALGTVTIQGLVDIGVDGGDVIGRLSDVSIGGQAVPEALLGRMPGLASQSPLTLHESVPLPRGLELTSASVGSGGLTVTARGSHLEFMALGPPPCAQREDTGPSPSPANPDGA